MVDRPSPSEPVASASDATSLPDDRGGDPLVARTTARLVDLALARGSLQKFVGSSFELLHREADLVAGLLVEIGPVGPRRLGEFGMDCDGFPSLEASTEWVQQVLRSGAALRTDLGDTDSERDLSDPGAPRTALTLPVNPDTALCLLFDRLGPSCPRELELGRVLAGLIGLVGRRLRSDEERMRESFIAETTLDAISDGIVSLSSDGRISFVNAAGCRLSGRETHELLGANLDHVLRFERPQDGTEVLDIVAHARLAAGGHVRERLLRLVSATGEASEVEVHYHEVPSASGIDETSIALTFSDVGRARQLSVELGRQVTHDSLTGLFNRSEFEQRLREVIRDSSDRSSNVLCFLDLDQFKPVNDACGHAAGDMLLRQLAGIIRSTLRRGDFVGRLGGDEFGLVLSDCDVVNGHEVATKLLDVIRDFRFQWGEKRFQVGASIGLVEIEPDMSLATLMSAVDRACYRAKERGRNRIEVGSVLGPARRTQTSRWVEQIQRGMVEDRLELFGQQIFRILPDGLAAAGIEILIRARDTDGKLVRPGVFLPAIERHQLGAQLDRWVLRRVLDTLVGCAGTSTDPEFVTVNLSAQSISDASFQAYVLSELERTGFEPTRLGFEVTETEAITDLAASRRFIDHVRARGVRVLLDDFGSGISAFTYLKELAVDQVKIDGRYVERLTENPADVVIVRSIDEVAKLTGKQTVAEQVQGPETLDILRQAGVDFAQGYGLHRPEPLHELLARGVLESEVLFEIPRAPSVAVKRKALSVPRSPVES